MKSRRSRALPIQDLDAKSKATYDALYIEASAGMLDPAFSSSSITHCKYLDMEDFPLDECEPSQARFAVLTVEAVDRAAGVAKDEDPNGLSDRADHVVGWPVSLRRRSHRGVIR
jgi:hypothetical protein